MTTGRQLKLAGMDRVARPHHMWLERLRDRLVGLALTRPVTIEDAREAAARYHLGEPLHPNAWGCVFRGPGWRRVGYVQASHPAAHARVVSMWRYEPSRAPGAPGVRA